MNTQSQSDEKYVGPRILYQAQTDHDNQAHATYDNPEKLLHSMIHCALDSLIIQ